MKSNVVALDSFRNRNKPPVIEEPNSKDVSSKFISEQLLGWAASNGIDMENPNVKQLCAGIRSNLLVMLGTRNV